MGIASALTQGLANLSNMTIVKLSSGYGDIAVAAYGIVKKIDMFPLGISMGLCQGVMPLVGYNYAAKNYKRMKDVSVFSWMAASAVALCFMGSFLAFAPWLLQSFIRDGQTGELGTTFLRIACLAVPVQSVNALIIYTLQAMGKGTQSTVFEYPHACYDELDVRTLRDDLDTVSNRTDHASGDIGNVCGNMAETDKTGFSIGGEVYENMADHRLFCRTWKKSCESCIKKGRPCGGYSAKGRDIKRVCGGVPGNSIGSGA